MRIPIIGLGHTKFGVLKESIGDLMLSACKEALEDAGMSIAEIDIIYIGNFSSRFSNQCHLPALLATMLKTNKEIVRVESACASGSLAIKEAVIAIKSGMYQNALVVGVEKMTETPIEETIAILASAASPDEIKHGATFSSLYALMAKSHFNKYGTTERDLAKISVKNHKNALKNKLAHFHKDITIEDALHSRVIASPLKLYDCSAISDGAAAIILSNKDTTTEKHRNVSLVGIGHIVESINLTDRENLASMPAVKKAAEKAYLESGLTPNDIDVVELHDCFTIAELIEMEELGFCEKGMSAQMVNEGKTEIQGELPINPSGGLKAKGHPIGATGVSQVVEIVKQLRGECEERQVVNAKFGLCCNVGGSGSTAIVSIFRGGE